MKDVAKNKEALKKRVSRFFESPSHDRAELFRLISELQVIGDVLLFGGALRDIALYGIKEFNSDIDLVIDCPPESLEEFIALKDINVAGNKFGGYRTEAGGWYVDFWSISNTWAFKNKKEVLVNKTSLLKTTITNWESILYSFHDGKVICEDNYFQDINNGLLDIVLEENPNQLGSLVRILRSIFDKDAKQITNRTISFINNSLSRWSRVEIITHELSTFNKLYFTKEDIDLLEREITQKQPDLFGKEIQKKGNNYSFEWLLSQKRDESNS